MGPFESHIDPDFDTESAASIAPQDHVNAPCDLTLLSGHLVRRNMVGEERYFWDGELPGFGLRVYASGSKRWIVQYRRRGTFRRVTIGKTDDLSAVDARRMARAILAENALDGLPQRPKTVRSDPRFSAYVEEFWHDYAGHWKPSTCNFASRAAAMSETLPMIGKLLGHSKIASTARYAHLDDADIIMNAEKIGARIMALAK